MKEFLLYRFAHADGTAKEWAYSDLGHGKAEIRWGPQGQLRQSQLKSVTEAWDRARQKVAKGYVRIGTVWLDEDGHPVPSPKATTKPVDLKVLLGSDDNFYF